MIKAVLCDLDGTLIDSERFYVNETKKWMTALGKDVPIEKCFAIVGMTMPETYTYLSKYTELSYEETKQSYDKHFKDLNTDFATLLFADVKPFFDELEKRGIDIAICSMSPKDYVEKMMKECELNAYIDFYIGGNEVKHNKPAPDIYLRALEVLRVNSKDVIIVEDGKVGIEAGKAAGCYVIARDASYINMDQSKADLIVSNINDVFKVIDNE